MTQTTSAKPPVVDQQTWRSALDELRRREKAATRELDAIAAQRRRLPMVEMPDYTLIGRRWLVECEGGKRTARSGNAAAAPASRLSSPGWTSSTTTTPAS